VLCLSLPAAASAQLAIVGGTVHPVDAKPIVNGVVLVKGSVIQYVGPARAIPAGYRVLNARGGVVTPGLIDTINHLGLKEINAVDMTVDGGEETHPILPDVRVLDALYLQSMAIVRARKAGITLAGVAPHGRNPVAGVGAVIRTIGHTTELAVVRKEAGLHIRLGEAPKWAFGAKKKAPQTRMGTVALIRKAFYDTVAYRAQRKRANEPPKRSLKFEALGKALDRKLTVWFHAHRVSDLEAAMRLVTEFKLKAVLVRGAQAGIIADVIARARLPVVVAPVTLSPRSMETQRARLDNAARLHRAGVPVAIGTFNTHNARNLPFQVGFARAHGLPDAMALSAVTLQAARILGVEKRFGSLTVGKQADVVVWDGIPFKVMTKPRYVVIGGKVVETNPTQP
jgi:imidazolonepropionase-like amidohydrolase